MKPPKSQARCARTLTPDPSPRGRGEPEREVHYRGGFPYAGLVKVARELRRRQTPAEEILWQLLRDRQLEGLKFRRQHQIGLFIADFYCHEARLVIELDGGVHQTPEAEKKDRWRDEDLESLGIQVLRIPNDQLLENPEEALDLILAAVGPRSEEP